jgi:hypothetical protein
MMRGVRAQCIHPPPHMTCISLHDERRAGAHRGETLRSATDESHIGERQKRERETEERERQRRETFGGLTV